METNLQFIIRTKEFDYTEEKLMLNQLLKRIQLEPNLIPFMQDLSVRINEKQANLIEAYKERYNQFQEVNNGLEMSKIGNIIKSIKNDSVIIPKRSCLIWFHKKD